MRFFWLLLVGSMVLYQCNSSQSFNKDEIVGQWRVDSIYNYANGFSHLVPQTGPDWIYYTYDAQGKVSEQKQSQQRSYHYQWIVNDSIVYTDTTGKFLSGFKILKLTSDNLVMKKHLKPTFPGKNQEFYEIRFFSRVHP